MYRYTNPVVAMHQTQNKCIAVQFYIQTDTWSHHTYMACVCTHMSGCMCVSTRPISQYGNELLCTVYFIASVRNKLSIFGCQA